MGFASKRETKIKQFIEKNPILFCIALEVFFLGLLWVVSDTVLSVTEDWDSYISHALIELLLAGIAFMLLWLSGQNYVLTRRGRGILSGLITGGYPLLVSVATLVLAGTAVLVSDFYEAVMGKQANDYILQFPAHIAAFICFAILVGAAEEFVFRGVIAERLIKRFGTERAGIVKAVVLSGILFGMGHLVNIDSIGFQAAVVQAVVVSFAGMVYAAIYYISGNLWALVCIHSFEDFSALAFQGGIYVAKGEEMNSIATAMNYTWLQLFGTIPYIIVLLVLLRKKNMQKIQENFTGKIEQAG